MSTYTTRGSVRGTCGHNHRSMRTAVRCLLHDQSGCRSQGGYSDRMVTHADGSPWTQDDEEAYYIALQGEVSP